MNSRLWKDNVRERNSWARVSLVPIYIFLVIWTPVFLVPPLPPIRFDDLFLFFVVPILIISSGRVVHDNVKGLQGLWFAFFFVDVITTTISKNLSSSAIFSVGNLFGSGVFVRYYLIAILCSYSIRSFNDFKIALFSVGLAFFSTMPIILAQYLKLDPIGVKSTSLYTRDSAKYMLTFDYRGFVNRPVGTIGNPNYLAGCSLIAALAIVVGYKWKRLYFSAITVSLALAFLVSGLFGASRTAILGLICAIIIYTLIKLWYDRKSVIPVLFGGAFSTAVCVILAIVFFDKLPTRMQTFLALNFTGSDMLHDSSMMSSRFVIWKMRIAEINSSLEYYFFGVPVSRGTTVDNDFIGFLYFGGVGMLLLFLFFWLAIAIKGVKFLKRKAICRTEVLAGYYALIAIGLIFALTSEGFSHMKYGTSFVVALSCFWVVLSSHKVRAK